MQVFGREEGSEFRETTVPAEPEVRPGRRDRDRWPGVVAVTAPLHGDHAGRGGTAWPSTCGNPPDRASPATGGTGERAHRRW